MPCAMMGVFGSSVFRQAGSIFRFLFHRLTAIVRNVINVISGLDQNIKSAKIVESTSHSRRTLKKARREMKPARQKEGHSAQRSKQHHDK